MQRPDTSKQAGDRNPAVAASRIVGVGVHTSLGFQGLCLREDFWVRDFRKSVAGMEQGL